MESLVGYLVKHVKENKLAIRIVYVRERMKSHKIFITSFSSLNFSRVAVSTVGKILQLKKRKV